MRPARIALEGFAAFREPSEVDLTDVELFALVGPTGAGKSTVIDAMVFALYGSVPRYDSENLVHPVIAQGAVEAKVRLDFTTGGHEYSATRVVRRTKAGATTKEARLERIDADDPAGGTVLAEDAKGLTAAVCELLGLDLEQFTKCVVLPQGAFATLLHDTKAKRQDLLVKLLDLGLYEQIASAARAEAKSLGFRLESLDEQLARSAHATDAAVDAATGHVAAVDSAVAALDEAGPELTAAREESATIERSLVTETESLALLRGLHAPDDVGDVGAAAADAADALERAAGAEADAAGAVVVAEEARAALGDDAELRSLLADHRALADLQERVDVGTRLVVELDEQRPALVAAVDEAAEATAAATARLDHARVTHAAADLARHLHPGDDCPVCGSTVTEVPAIDAGALDDAERAVAAATDAERAAARALADHDTTLAEHRTRLAERTRERDTVAARLEGKPGLDEAERLLSAVAEADTRLAEARRADADARRATAAARAAADAAAARVASARAGFLEARDRVAHLGPPAPGDDLTTDWKALVAWAEDEATARQRGLADARRRLEEATRRLEQRTAELAERARAAGVDVSKPPGGRTGDVSALRDACVAEAAAARTRLDQLTAERDHAADLRAERATADERRQVHELLAEQLGARGFEAWLLDEAVAALLDGASGWLERLSSGRYAMTVDDKNAFAVVDHANADERRLAKTLSGGETFLASLALALALAERVGELSAGGGSSLEAIFLDEGFGTLDPDTLDVVATAIEELGATGRMVGIVSHVRELAERVPVRFEIAKQPGTSVVRRVDT